MGSKESWCGGEKGYDVKGSDLLLKKLLNTWRTEDMGPTAGHNSKPSQRESATGVDRRDAASAKFVQNSDQTALQTRR
jgi:hypothetical protein